MLLFSMENRLLAASLLISAVKPALTHQSPENKGSVSQVWVGCGFSAKFKDFLDSGAQFDREIQRSLHDCA